MADIGYIALLLAFLASLYTVVAFALGAGKRADLTDSARNGLIAVCALVTVASGVLMYALISHDFQIEYVANYTSRDLPIAYLISAFWAGNAGSLMFWAWALTVVSVIVVLTKWRSNPELVPWAAAILMGTEALFLALLLFVANPFQALPSAPPDGAGLNPLLQNPGMLFHPPTLLFGYLAFSVPFAFAVAALITRRLDDEWIVSTRTWTILAWLSLGVGNLLGAWWAYVELGWGGYWAWDPVENAGLMPWLVGTALLHSVMMQRRRGMFKMWNMVLVILTFGLTMFSTVLVRSGLSQAHGFSEVDRGPLTYFLVFIVVAMAGSFSLLFLRRNDLDSEAEVESLVSRESTFMVNNLLLMGAAAVVFLGTMFPVFSQAVIGTSIGVTRGFFDEVAAPILLAVIVLIGICAVIGWKRASARKLAGKLAWPGVVAAAVTAVLFVIGVREWLPLVALFLCMFVGLTMLYELLRGAAARHRLKAENYVKAFFAQVWANKPRYGGYIVHIGVILVGIGIVGSSFFQAQTSATLKPGQSMSIGKFTLTYQGVESLPPSSVNITSTTGTTLSVADSGRTVGELTALLSQTPNLGTVTEVGIRSTLAEDLYVIPQSIAADGTATFEVLINPVVMVIWIGGIVLFVGGVIAFWPDSRNGKRRKPGEGEDLR